MTQSSETKESRNFGVLILRHILAFASSTFGFFVIWFAANWGYNIESLALTFQCACLWLWLLVVVAPSSTFLESRFENSNFSWITKSLIVFAVYFITSTTILMSVILIANRQLTNLYFVLASFLLASLPGLIYWAVFSWLRRLDRQS